ncbi:MAG: LysR family transcriptional regulator [Solirubrobacteraceae bacterium]
MDFLRHLRYFVVVAEELHFGRAAERLRIAQPPLSQRIKALERTFGVELLVRTTRRVELTPAGALLLEEARAVVERVERLESALADVRAGTVGTVRIGVSPDLTPAVLADLVSELATRHPAIALVPVEQEQQEQLRALTDRRIDLGFVRWPVADAMLRCGAPVKRPLGALVCAGDPLAAGAELELAELGAARALVLFPRDAAPARHDAIVATCHALGCTPSDVLAATDVAFAAGLVLTSDAFAIIEAPASPPEGAVWRPFAGGPLSITASTVWRQGDQRAIVTVVADVLREVLAQSGRWNPVAASCTPPPWPGPRPADSLLA